MRKNLYDFIFYILVFASIISFYLLNMSIPINSDDWAYMNIYRNHLEVVEGVSKIMSDHVETISDACYSQYNHYFTMNGRSIVHFLVQCFCGIWGKRAYNIFVTLLFGTLIFLLGKIIKNDKNYLYVGIILILFFSLLFKSIFCTYWSVAYGTNYLWSLTICLLFVFLVSRVEKPTLGYRCILFSIAFLAGWSHEGMAIPMCTGLSLWAFVNRKQIPMYKIVSVAISVIGLLFLCLAPGNFARVGNDVKDNAILSLLANSRLLYLYSFCLVIGYIKSRKNVCEHIKQTKYWIASLLVMIAFLIIIRATNNARSLFGIELMSLILFLKFVFEIGIISEKKVKMIGTASAFLFTSLLLYVSYYQIPAGRQIDTVVKTVSKENFSGNPILLEDMPTVPSILSDKLVLMSNPWNMEMIDSQYHCGELQLYYGLPTFTSKDKVLGDNHFYRVGDYIYSVFELPKNLEVSIELGSYTCHSFLSCLKYLYCLFFGYKNNYLRIVLDIETIGIEGKTYYRTYLPLNMERSINSIDVIYTNKNMYNVCSL